MSSIPTAKSLYVKIKYLLSTPNVIANCSLMKTWNQLMSELSFPALDTLPTQGVRVFNLMLSVLCVSTRPTKALILGGCPVALVQHTVMIKYLVFWPLNSKNFLATIYLLMFLLISRVYEIMKNLKPLFHLTC